MLKLEFKQRRITWNVRAYALHHKAAPLPSSLRVKTYLIRELALRAWLQGIVAPPHPSQGLIVGLPQWSEPGNPTEVQQVHFWLFILPCMTCPIHWQQVVEDNSFFFFLKTILKCKRKMRIGLQAALHHHDRRKTVHYLIELVRYLLLHVDPNCVNRFLIIAA